MKRPGNDEATSDRLDRVFTALGDATRRSLLDRLHLSDGQRLGQLAEGYEMSRQAIAKHLEVLEDAGLVTVRREVRETRYLLNRAPLRAVQSLWIEKYTVLQARVDCA
jgi:DNA-binding transcriptional ArsR family regulator